MLRNVHGLVVVTRILVDMVRESYNKHHKNLTPTSRILVVAVVTKQTHEINV